MTIAEELYQMGIPEAECSRLAGKIADAAVVSGTSSAVDRILVGLRILMESNASTKLANYSAGLLKK